MQAVQKPTALHCRIGLDCLEWHCLHEPHLLSVGCAPQLCFNSSSTASVPRLFICPLKDYLQCKVHCTVQHDVCIVLCTSLCSLCSAHDNCIFYSHSIRTLMEPPGTLGDTQEHSGTLRNTQRHSWNPWGQSGTLLEPSGTIRDTPGTLRDIHGTPNDTQGHSWRF